MSTHVKKVDRIPATVTGGEGSSKRNVLRKNGGASVGAVGGINKSGACGKPIDDGSLYNDPSALDEHDPNYDSEEETRVDPILKVSGLKRSDIGRSKLTLSAYKKQILSIINEFFVSNEFDELANSLQELEAPEYSYEFVKRLINISLDKTDRERELVSQLLSTLYPDVLSANIIGKGFERLFEIVDEITIDCPHAKSALSSFLARAIVDEILPPSYLNDNVINNLGGEIIEQTKILLTKNHGLTKIEKVWGPGDGRPVSELKVIVDQIIQEFLLSNDVEEAIKCLNELNTPLFFHEIVKRSMVLSLDRNIGEQALISKLLKELVKKDLLTEQQTIKGFNRVHDLVPDLKLDTPNCEDSIALFTQRAIDDGILPKNYIPTLSSNSRKNSYDDEASMETK